MSTARQLVWPLVRQEPVAYAVGLISWTAFQCLPVLAGVLLKVVLDRVQVDGPSRLIFGALAALAGVELSRWLILVFSAWQWHGMWVFWHTVPRLNMLRSLVAAPGPTAGRLPGSPGEAVSRFRDDSQNLSLVADVWLDMTASAVATGFAVYVMARVDWRVTMVVAIPVPLTLLLTQVLARRLKELRLAEREATSAVTSFIGGTFGAITAIKAAGAEPSVLRRFDSLGDSRAVAALRDQVGTQTLQTLAGATGNLCTGLALLLLAPALADGAATVGDVGLFASAALVIANFPRWVARLGAYHRQGDVSADRMVRLLSPDQPDQLLTSSVTTQLREGPGIFQPTPIRSGPGRSSDRLRTLQVRGLTVHHPAATIGPLDLELRAGTVTVLTGPVGSGKSTVLRALLGLIARDAGDIRWNGVDIDDPATVMVPPRVSYLPQVPRLFSETLAQTILLGVEDDGLDAAIAMACLDADLERMGEGLDTPVGARGVRLSGGQIQRTAAARAFVRRPDLLVVDDLSSALDIHTETQVWDRLLGGDPRPTLLVVSHRPRVLAAADQVIRLPSLS